MSDYATSSLSTCIEAMTPDEVENQEVSQELKELTNLNIWSEDQKVLEQQALDEFEIFAQQHREIVVAERVDLEDGEISDHEPEAKVLPKPALNIKEYINRQAEFKKRQEHKRSLQVSDKSKITACKISKRHNQELTAKILKRKLKASTSNEKRKKLKLDQVTEDKVSSLSNETLSDDEYLPSNDSDSECGSTTHKPKSSRQSSNIEKVKDDGNLKLYNLRMKEYYSQLENNNEEPVPEDIMLKNGLKVPGKMWNDLYSYQQKGVKWLWKVHQDKIGCLLGDEMGLGKTVQIIVFLAALENSKLISRHNYYTGLGPTLIVCPATVILQWVKHFHDWAPEFRVAVLHNSGSYAGKKIKLIKEINKCKGVLITSYSGILKYKGNLNELKWHYAILDEGHKIRNHSAKISIAVKQLQTLHRVILTGSPMQNNLQELWSLFDFITPSMLGTLNTFVEHFANPIMQGGYANATPMQEATALSVASALKEMITPYLLRRTKNEVKDYISLPNKSEQVLFCSLTEEQKDLYKGFLMSEHVNNILGRGAKNWFAENKTRASVLVAITTLRKICNHPDLYLEEPDSNYTENKPLEESYGYYKRSGKMVVVSALLKIWKRQSHRVLLFTQARKVIELFETFLTQQGYKYLKMDGSTNISTRQPLIDKFNNDASYDVFLLTTRVGGIGVNLTGANRVIIFDPDWNPATDTQARERAWRIGQQREVTVYRLILAGTIEEKMYQRQVWKQLLSNKILLDPKTQRFFKTSDLHDLFSLQEHTDGSNTETANIFRNSRVHLQEKLEAKKKSKTSDDSFQFSDEKIQAMKILAQQLSKNIATSKKSEEPKSAYQKQIEEERNQKLQEKEYLKTLTPIELRDFNRKKMEVNDESVNEIDDNETTASFSQALEISEKTSKLYHKNKTCKLAEATGTTVLSNKLLHDKIKKKKTKDSVKTDTSGKVDGVSVEGLIKTETKRKEKKVASCSATESQDNYVLEKLFSRKGVQTALQHEVIVQSDYKSNDNVIKLHWEAQQRTEASLQALRKSRLDNWRY